MISSDVTAGLTKLKLQPDRPIVVAASGTPVRFLLAEGLLGELRLLVHPVVVGTGKHLFEGGGHVPLNQVESPAAQQRRRGAPLHARRLTLDTEERGCEE